MKKIWIDLDNTPHVPFFRPIIAQLESRGYQVKVTARDAFQVYDLADYFRLRYQRIGRHYGKSSMMKVLGSLVRAGQLMAAMVKEKPALAVSHGSRTQLVAARLLGIPSVMIYDYEHAKGLLPFNPVLVMVPEVIPDAALSGWRSPVYKYPGIKEDVYVPAFVPDPDLVGQLGLTPDSLVVTLRPPATEAHYYSPESQVLFEATVTYLVAQPGLQIVLLPRNQKQEAEVRVAWQELIRQHRIVIPDRAVDGLNLIWFSDLVVSGGGTMNREAAALGVPVYSIFRSELGAVDRYLAETGRLVLVESPADFTTKLVLSRRDKDPMSLGKTSPALESIVEQIILAAEAS